MLLFHSLVYHVFSYKVFTVSGCPAYGKTRTGICYMWEKVGSFISKPGSFDRDVTHGSHKAVAYVNGSLVIVLNSNESRDCVTDGSLEIAVSENKSCYFVAGP